MTVIAMFVLPMLGMAIIAISAVFTLITCVYKLVKFIIRPRETPPKIWIEILVDGDCRLVSSAFQNRHEHSIEGGIPHCANCQRAKNAQDLPVARLIQKERS